MGDEEIRGRIYLVDAPSFTDRVKRRIAFDLRYFAGMLCMFEERNRVYRADYNRASTRGDTKRMAEIAEDLAAFRREMDGMEAKQGRAKERLETLNGGEGFTNDSVQTQG